MKTSIYISAEQIQAIGHNKGVVSDYASFPLPEGTMYNGTIIDQPFLTECLVSMKAQNGALFSGNVSLIVDGGSILSRRIAAPKLSDKQYKQLVRDDFADSIENTADLVCGYHKLSSADNAIMACAVNKTQVDSYISAFSDAGIKLGSMHAGAEMVLNLVSATPELQKSTIVINIIDSLTMLSMLFDDGVNVFMSRTRLYGDVKEQVYQNALDNLNGLIQFTRSQKFNDITVSYYLGIGAQDMKVMEALNPYANIKLKTCDIFPQGSALPHDAHFACLNMLYGESGIDLVKARRELDKYIKSRQPKKIWIPIFAAYCVLLAIPAVYLYREVYQLQSQIDELQSYVTAPGITQRLEELSAVESDTSRLNTVLRQYSAKTALEDSRASARGEMLDMIINMHGESVIVTSFDFNEASGVARISARCADAAVSANYVDALIAIGVARSVDYRGYGSGGDGVYNFTIDIVVES